jgi:hypothetical protein
MSETEGDVWIFHTVTFEPPLLTIRPTPSEPTK